MSQEQLARQARRERRRRASYRRSRWWVRLAVGCALLVFALYTAWVAILTPQRVAGFVSDVIAESTQARVHVGAARVGFPGILHIDELELRLPDMEGRLGRLVEVDHATLSLDLSALLAGELRPEKLTLWGPVVHINELPDLELYNYQLLPLKDDAADDPAKVNHVPEIHIHAGRLQFGTVRKGQYEPGERLTVVGRMLNDPRDPDWFAFVLRQQLDRGQSGPTLSGRVDLTSGAFSAELDKMALNSPQRNLVPERFRQWWDRLNPSGSFPHASVAFDPDSASPWTAQIEVDGVGLTLPFGERPVELAMASGTVRFVDDAVHVERLMGRIDQVDYEIDGRYEGVSVDAPFRIEARLDGVWPNDPEVLAAIPEQVRKHIDRFQPQGSFKGAVVARRGGEGGKIDVDGSLRLSGASLLYHKFPYPLTNGAGEVTFSADEIRLVGLRGTGPGGAVITCEGIVLNPGPAAEAKLQITAKGLPLDDALIAAMKPEVRNLTEMFFDEAAREPLAELAQLEQLGGKADVKIEIVRPAGEGMRTEATIHAQPVTPIHVSFRHWPYPVTVKSGRLMIQPKKYVRIDEVKISSPTGLVGEVNGELLPHKTTGKLVPDVHFELDRLPVDDVLLATLPQSHAQHLRDLSISGRIAAIGTVFHSDKTGRLEFVVRAQLIDGKAAPFAGTRQLEALEAEFQVRRHELVLDSARMRHGGGDYTLDGRVQWARPPVANAPPVADAPQTAEAKNQHHIRLHATGRNIVVDPTLLDLAPPDTKHVAQLREMLQHRNVSGRADVDVTYVAAGDSGVELDMVLQPHTLAFDKRGSRLQLQEMSGRLVATTDEVTIEKIAGSFGQGAAGRFDISGKATFDEGLKVEAVASLSAEVSNDVAKLMLPRNIVNAIDQMGITGAYRLHDVRVRHQPGATTGDTLQVAGMATFENLAGSIGSVEVQRLDGEARVAVRQPVGAAHPYVDSKINLHRMALAGRPVRDVSMRVVTDANDTGRLLLMNLTGIAAGGELSGQGGFGLADASAFNMRLNLADAQLEQLLRKREVQESFTPAALDNTSPGNTSSGNNTAAHAAAARDNAASPAITGLVSARLDLSGTFGDTKATRGSGSVRVYQARLYELPVVLGMLQVINMALPLSSSFDEAAMVFDIHGEEARLNRIALDARGVQIAGSGTMNYRSQELDIILTTRNPSAPDIWPISDLFNAVKDGLIKVHITGTLRKPNTRLASFGPEKAAQADAGKAAR